MQRKKTQASQHMIARARQLRRESSFPERLLWSRPRNGRCEGLKFRRQHPIGAYVADFVCASANVIVELDGRSHDEREECDQARQAFLEQQGYQVIRVSNDRLLRDLDGIVEAIATVCMAAPPSPGPAGRPLPEGEE